MNRTALRVFESLDFREPSSFLIQLHQFECEVAKTDTPARLRTLRTNGLKEWREVREAAMFCYLMGQRIGETVYMARGENQDYDFVASWTQGDTRNFAPVQLKELVPLSLNPESSIEKLLAALPKKYVDSHDLTVVIHLNQRNQFDLAALEIPALSIGGLWMFGATTPDQSAWGLWGDFLHNPTHTAHVHPAA
jgi:hypothetical protein